LGKEPPANTEIANGDDLRKWLTSTVLAEQPVVLLDNVNARLGGSALAAALTKIDWADRILGTSRLARGTINCLWLATGNNLTMTVELARRVVRCRLDGGLMRPFLRCGFTHPDLRMWAKANRHELIWAVLTLVQHWIAQGQPQGSKILGSYENYCRIVGGILQAAGIDGFLDEVQCDQNRGDETTIEWTAFVAAWFARFGIQRVNSEALDKEILGPDPEMLSLTLITTASERGRRVKLGQELRKRRDAVLGDCRIRISDSVDRHGCWHYWLEPIDNDEEE
jgi:putative DNA primase/helicase